MPRRCLLLVGLMAFASIAVKPGFDDRLITRWNRFAVTSRVFTASYNSGAFDVAAARTMSKQWREIEASGEWPK